MRRKGWIFLLIFSLFAQGSYVYANNYNIVESLDIYEGNQFRTQFSIDNGETTEPGEIIVSVPTTLEASEDNEYGAPYSYGISTPTVYSHDINVEYVSSNAFAAYSTYAYTSGSWPEFVEKVRNNPDEYLSGGTFTNLTSARGREMIILERSSAETELEEYEDIDYVGRTYDLAYSANRTIRTFIHLKEFDHLGMTFCINASGEGNGHYQYEGSSDNRGNGLGSAMSAAESNYATVLGHIQGIEAIAEVIPFSENQIDSEPVVDTGFIQLDIDTKAVEGKQLVLSGSITSSSDLKTASLIRASGGAAVQGSVNLGEPVIRPNGDRLWLFTANCEFGESEKPVTEENVYYFSVENEQGSSSEKRIVVDQNGTVTAMIENVIAEDNADTDETDQIDNSDLTESEKNELKNLINSLAGFGGTNKVPGPESVATAAAGVLSAPFIAMLAELLKKKREDDPFDGKTGEEVPDRVLVGKTDGRIYHVKYDPKTGKWIDDASGNEIRVDDFERAESDIEADKKMAHETAKKLGQRDTANDKAIDELVEEQKENAKMLERIHHVKKEIYTGNAKGLYKGDGEPGDMITKINKMESGMKNGVGLSRDDYEKIKRVYGKHLFGDTLPEDQLPKGQGLGGDLIDMAKLSGEEIARGESYKSMALKTLVGIATGGTSEIGFEGAKALMTMKDYVDKGGDSALEAFKLAAEQTIKDEIMGRIVEGGIKTAVKGGKGAVKYIKDNADEIKGEIQAAKNNLAKKLDELHQGLALNKQTAVDQFAKQAGKAEEEALELIKKSRKNIEDSGDLLKRDEAFFSGRKEGLKKIQQLESARKALEKNPDSLKAKKAFKDSVEKVQMDKHAMHQMNDLPGETGQKLRKGFNQQMEETYETSIDNTKKRLADEYGVSVDDIEVVKATNSMEGKTATAAFAKKGTLGKETSAFDYSATKSKPKVDGQISGDKSGYDKDVTFRLKQKNALDVRTGKTVKGDSFVDIPEKDAKRIYNEEFYKAARDGEIPLKKTGSRGLHEVDSDVIDEYAHKMDQTAGDRLSTESYGSRNEDLMAAVREKNKNFSDVEAVGKTMEYKANHWDKMGEELLEDAKKAEHAGDFLKADEMRMAAEACKEEGIRQTTKQFNNQVIERAALLNAAAGKPIVIIPDKLLTAVKVMEQTGKPGGISVAEAEAVLKEMGLTSRQVAEQSSALLEGMQKLKPQ